MKPFGAETMPKLPVRPRISPAISVSFVPCRTGRTYATTTLHTDEPGAFGSAGGSPTLTLGAGPQSAGAWRAPGRRPYCPHWVVRSRANVRQTVQTWGCNRDDHSPYG